MPLRCGSHAAYHLHVRVPVTFSSVTILTVLAASLFAQDRPLEMRFSEGATSVFRIQLKVTTRVEGQQAVTIGANGYVKPFVREATATISWAARVRVASFSAGSASIEEALDDFQMQSPPSSDQTVDPETVRLQRALQASLLLWASSRTIAYVESLDGQATSVPAEAAPDLGEQSPRVLTAWLLRALRPVAVLPAHVLRFDDHWLEPRSVTLPGWSSTTGSESGQWLAAAASKSEVRLHVVQQIDGTVASGPEKPPEGTAVARFHSESLSTISLDDARLFKATRSATREIDWTLQPVGGLSEPPKFNSRLAVEIQIENCDETPCSNLQSAFRGGAAGAD